MILLDILIVLLIGGLIAFLIQRAPFIDEPYKSWALYAVLVIVVITIIMMLLGRTPGITHRWTLR